MAQSNPTYPMFSRQEMDRRLARARSLMAQNDLDALLITGEHNFHYFVGAAPSIGPNESLARPSAFILPAVGDPIIVSQGRDNIEQGTYITDIRDYFDVLQFPYELVGEALRDRGLSAGRIGAELGQEQRMGVPVGDYLSIVGSMPEARFVDAADVIIKTRMVKSDEEVSYMREAARITARARHRLYTDYLTPGVTERQFARQFQKLVLEEGADGTSFVHFQFDIQSELPGAKHAFHYDRPLRPGVILGIDTGARVGMYTVDYPRMVSLGPPTDRQKRLYDQLLEVNRHMVEALRPGVEAADIHMAGVQAMKDLGVETDNPERLTGGSRMGHGQGIQFTEPPSVTPTDHTVLEVGTVISTEPGIGDGELHLLWEDTHVVTETGSDLITTESDELREVAF